MAHFRITAQKRIGKISNFQISSIDSVLYHIINTYNFPANPAALFDVTMGSAGLHMMMTSWSDIMTTPGSLGNQIRTLTKPCHKNELEMGDSLPRHLTFLTFFFRTPHRLRSVMTRLYINWLESVGSDRIWHSRSKLGSTCRSSANIGVPRNPSGFRSFAVRKAPGLPAVSANRTSPNEHRILATS